MTIQLADGEPGTLHIHDDASGSTLCGAQATTPSTRHSWDDLLCGACMTAMKNDDTVEFGDVILQIEQFVAGRLARLPYSLYLRTEHWKRTRTLALDRYGSACVLCNATPVNVHHRTYERLGNERLDDLIVLCEPCHRRHHKA